MTASRADANADTSPPDPTKALGDVLHQRVRLGILSVLHEAHRVDFNFLLETSGLTGGRLSQYLRVLADAGFVTTDNAMEGRRPRMWVSITRAGRRALLEEIDALEAIVRRVETRQPQS